MTDPPKLGAAELVEQAASGDLAARTRLLEKYLPSVQAYLRKRAGHQLLEKESASDLAQSVCRAVLEYADRFQHDQEEGFRRWLFKTAERKVMDRHAYYQAQKRHPNEGELAGVDVDAALPERGRMQTPSRDAMAREELARLGRAIERLPEDMQEVVILSRIMGLPRNEVAQELGKSEGAVRMLLHRALARLADQMANEAES